MFPKAKREMRTSVAYTLSNNGSFLIPHKISELLKVGYVNDFMRAEGVITVQGP